MSQYKVVLDFNVLQDKVINPYNTNQVNYFRNIMKDLLSKKHFTQKYASIISKIESKNNSLYSLFLFILFIFDRFEFFSQTIEPSISFDITNNRIELVYNTSSIEETKEIFCGTYIGRKTGNIYSSSSKDSIILGNISQILYNLDINLSPKMVVYYIQKLKLSLDFEEFFNNLIQPFNNSFIRSIFINLEKSVSKEYTLIDFYSMLQVYSKFGFHFLQLGEILNHLLTYNPSLKEDENYIEFLSLTRGQTYIPSIPAYSLSQVKENIIKTTYESTDTLINSFEEDISIRNPPTTIGGYTEYDIRRMKMSLFSLEEIYSVDSLQKKYDLLKKYGFGESVKLFVNSIVYPSTNNPSKRLTIPSINPYSYRLISMLLSD